VVVNNFYVGMEDKIPVGVYEDKSYFFSKGYGHQKFLQ
jgi:hypothetical protein